MIAEANGACCNPGTKHRWNKWTARIDMVHHSVSPPSCSLRDCQNNLVFGVTTKLKNQKDCYHLFFSSSSQRLSNVTNKWEPSNTPDMAQKCNYLGNKGRSSDTDGNAESFFKPGVTHASYLVVIMSGSSENGKVLQPACCDLHHSVYTYLFISSCISIFTYTANQ